MARSRGYRRVTMVLAAEHLASALVTLSKHACVDPSLTGYHSGHLHFSIDHACLPDGDAPAVELVIRRAIEAERKP